MQPDKALAVMLPKVFDRDLFYIAPFYHRYISRIFNNIPFQTELNEIILTDFIIQIVPRQRKTDCSRLGHEVQSGFGPGKVRNII